MPNDAIKYTMGRETLGNKMGKYCLPFGEKSHIICGELLTY